MKILHEERYDRFMDAVKLSFIMWRRSGKYDFSEISAKLGISERTVRRRFNAPETLTLGELFAWCELYEKDPVELLQRAFSEGKRECSPQTDSKIV